MIRSILLLAPFAAVASAAAAQPQPRVGMVSDPCEALVVAVPDAVRAYFYARMAMPQTRTPPPPELAVYRLANAEARKSDWPDLCRYHADNERLRAGPKSERRVVFIGDSITELWVLGDPDLFSKGIVNRGISGQTSPQILLRFQADVVALQPVIVHILAGTNDIAGNTGPTSTDQYKDNIKAMVSLAKSNGIKVILGSIPPAAHFPWKPDLKPVPQIAALNDWLRSYAEAEKLEFVDYHAALTTRDGAINDGFSFDGVHLNLRGYRLMTRAVRRSLPAEAGPSLKNRPVP